MGGGGGICRNPVSPRDPLIVSPHWNVPLNDEFPSMKRYEGEGERRHNVRFPSRRSPHHSPHSILGEGGLHDAALHVKDSVSIAVYRKLDMHRQPHCQKGYGRGRLYSFMGKRVTAS